MTNEAQRQRGFPWLDVTVWSTLFRRRAGLTVCLCEELKRTGAQTVGTDTATAEVDGKR